MSSFPIQGGGSTEYQIVPERLQNGSYSLYPNTLTSDSFIVDTNTDDQVIYGRKFFKNETKFLSYAESDIWTDIAQGLIKSSCFTRGAFMQLVCPQILAPICPDAVPIEAQGFYPESGKIKFQSCTANNGQVYNPVDILILSTSGINALYEITAPSYKVTNGTSSQFLKADGSIDETSYSKKAYVEDKTLILD